MSWANVLSAGGKLLVGSGLGAIANAVSPENKDKSLWDSLVNVENGLAGAGTLAWLGKKNNLAGALLLAALAKPTLQRFVFNKDSNSDTTTTTEQPQQPKKIKRWVTVNEATDASKIDPKEPSKQQVASPVKKQNTTNTNKPKTRVLYSDAKADTDEYKQIKSSNDFTRSYKDYANRKDLTEAQKEQRAVADVMAWRRKNDIK